PVPGLELKLTPVEGKLEARYRGPNVTPGYWRQPELNAASFDEEGFFRTGDAIQFVDANNPNKGLLFDGRLAEDFKLTTGTWVSVGALRAQIVKLGAPLVREAVITGHNRDYVGALLFLHVDACQALAGVPADTPATDVYAHAAIQARIQQLLDDMAAQATGISNRLERVTIASEPPSIDVGEITDKGSFNQRAILQHRAALVEELYEDPRREYVLERVHSNA
ncbi:MAG: AMP-binding protein, partial [Caldilineaceae bacterium]|nr:AMP-binding protein [Caldilineaceae bacterium]